MLAPSGAVPASPLSSQEGKWSVRPAPPFMGCHCDSHHRCSHTGHPRVCDYQLKGVGTRSLLCWGVWQLSGRSKNLPIALASLRSSQGPAQLEATGAERCRSGEGHCLGQELDGLQGLFQPQ